MLISEVYVAQGWQPLTIASKFFCREKSVLPLTETKNNSCQNSERAHSTVSTTMAYKHIPLYFLIATLGFVGLFILCCIANILCPYEKIRQAFALCWGYKNHEGQKAMKQRRKLLDEEEEEGEETFYLKYTRTHLI